MAAQTIKRKRCLLFAEGFHVQFLLFASIFVVRLLRVKVQSRLRGAPFLPVTPKDFRTLSLRGV